MIPAAGGARAQAARVLAFCFRTGAFTDTVLEREAEVPALCHELVMGVMRHRRALQWMLQALVPRRPGGTLEALLLCGLYQVFHTRIPAHAAVHETVAAAHVLARGGGPRLVNAVLRRVTRERETWLRALAEQPWPVQCSHPDLLTRRWCESWGEVMARELCRWNNGRPDTWLHVNTARRSLAEACAAMKAAGVNVQARGDSWLRLPARGRIRELPGYDEGWFTVQDPATVMAVDLLDPQPGETILDACAAPGGKTILIAGRMGGRGTLTAVDSDPMRLERLAANLSRTRWEGFVQTVRADLQRERSPAGPYDRILLDVPCTNTGVIRRRPDVRWHFSRRRLATIVALQRVLLTQAAERLRPGGLLVYSTCSLETEENESQVEAWLAAHPGWKLRVSRRLWPTVSGTDGAYAALLSRENGRQYNPTHPITEAADEAPAAQEPCG